VAPLRGKTVFTLPAWAPPAAILAVVLLGFWLSQRMSAKRANANATPSASAESAADAYELERQHRARRVCEETAQRITRGATVSAADVEGWVVQFRAVRPERAGAPRSAAALAAFVRIENGARGRFVWPEAGELAALDGPTTFVELRDEAGSSGLTGITLTFFGRYVSPYFVEEERPIFMQVAAALSEQLGARHAGLFARCEHGQSHYLGAWFRGETSAAGVAALVVWMGAHADVPFLDDALLASDAGKAFDPVAAFAPLTEQAARLERTNIARIIGEHGGMISGKPDGITTLSFPFRDGNRATRSSLDLARALGVARVSAR